MQIYNFRLNSLNPFLSTEKIQSSTKRTGNNLPKCQTC